MIGSLALLLAMGTVLSSPAYCRIVHSAQNFQRYYHDLKQGDNSLNPIERIVFSLVLANSRNPEQTTVGRT
jgi:hypothetical protein